MAQHELDLAAFRAMFPGAFPNPPYTDPVITAYWSIASCAMDTADSCALSGDCLQTALNLMTAHIMTILGGAGASGRPVPVGVKVSATVDKVSVSYSAPPFNSGWQAWLSQSPYGLTLWALLSAHGSGGFYFGGLPELDGIRKVYGTFGTAWG